MKTKKATFADIINNLPPPAPRPDVLEEMGESVLRIPFHYWEERFWFRGALNTALREKTGVFPARLGLKGETHPVYMLRKIGNLGFQACPCTSKSHKKALHIRKGCVLEITKREVDRNSYILRQMVFNLTEQDSFRRNMMFIGRVPESCLQVNGLGTNRIQERREAGADHE